MRSRYLRPAAALTILAVSVITLTAAPSSAGGQHCASTSTHARHGGHYGKAHWKNYRAGQRVRYVVVREPRRVIVRPATVDWFCWQRPRFLVVRPVPVWVAPYRRDGLAARIGIHDGSVSFDLAFSNSAAAYGCGFCGTNFARYGEWETHVHECDRAPDRPIVCERWEDDELAEYRVQARAQWEQAHGEYRDG